MLRKRVLWLSLLSAGMVTAACDSNGGKKTKPQEGTELPDSGTPPGDGDTGDGDTGDGDTGDGDGPQTGSGSITGFVFDAEAPYAALSNISIIGPGGQSVISAEDGSFTLTGLPEGIVPVRAEGDNHSHVVHMVRVLNEGASHVEFQLGRVFKLVFDLEKGGRAKDKSSGVSATFKENSLQTKDGKPATGKATISVVSVADNAKIKSGTSNARDAATKRSGSLKGTSTVEVRVTDEKGQKLQLVNGKDAEIELPIATKAKSPPKEIGLWTLNEKDGTWSKDGTATKSKNTEGKPVYKAKIKHMSWFAADSLVPDAELTCVRGCVKSASGAALPGASVVLTAADSPFRGVESTDAEGCFYVNLEPSLSIEVVASTSNGMSGGKRHTTSATPKLFETNPAACDDLGDFSIAPLPAGTRCPAGLTRCGDVCVDLHNDANSCGNTCATAVACNGDPSSGGGNSMYGDWLDPAERFVCVSGVCDCPPGWLKCGDRCIDGQNNPKHCGTSCTVYDVCDSQTETCEDGVCKVPTCLDNETACQLWPTSDVSVVACVDLNSDEAACGSCENNCNGYENSYSSEPARACINGSCECGQGFTKCGQEGNWFFCVDTQNDDYYCGGCNDGTSETACLAEESCVNGTCTALDCPVGQIACNHECVDPQTNPSNCGECDTYCYSNESCVAGECTPLDCGEGASACDSQCVPREGEHCLGCYSGCYGGQVCQAGECSCEAPLALCNSVCVDLQSDSYNCGECNTQCSSGEACENGACVPKVCAEGLTLCGSECVDVDFAAYHCGGCDNACDYGMCFEGECHCPQGWLLCPTPWGQECTNPDNRPECYDYNVIAP